ncbi:carbohydrate ABC transporter permease, partial [Micromonospora zhanjiangensis]
MAVIVLYCVAPFYWMIVSSLRRTSNIFAKSPLPDPVSLENYRAVLDPAQGFGRALLNSLVVAGTTTVLALLIGTVCGYALARLPLRFKRTLLLFVIAMSMFPVVAIVVFVGAWNEFMIALSMTDDAAVQTAPVAIAKFTGATKFATKFETPFGSQMAAGVLVTIPLVVLVLMFQRRIVAGLTAGGVKYRPSPGRPPFRPAGPGRPGWGGRT